MTFIDHIGPLYELKSDALKNLLNWLNSHAEFNTGKVLLPAGMRKECCDDLNISTNTLTNYLKRLKDHKLISGSDGIYLINPEIFWKGDTKTRAQLMQDETLRITFSIS
jgi:DNA-binding transcriptional MocR family regulator